MLKRILVVLSILAMVGTVVPALAQGPNPRTMSLRQVANEMLCRYGSYRSEGAQGFTGVPQTVSADQKEIFLVSHSVSRHKPKSVYDSGIEIAVAGVSVIRVTGRLRGRNAFRGVRTDYKMVGGRCRRYRVAFGYHHPRGRETPWVTGWYAPGPVPAWHATPRPVLTELTSAARRALVLRRHNLGDLWRVKGEDLVIARNGARQGAALAVWNRAFPDYVVHQDAPLVRLARDAHTARRQALAALRRGGLKASVVVLGFPGLF